MEHMRKPMCFVLRLSHSSAVPENQYAENAPKHRRVAPDQGLEGDEVPGYRQRIRGVARYADIVGALSVNEAAARLDGRAGRQEESEGDKEKLERADPPAPSGGASKPLRPRQHLRSAPAGSLA